MIRNEKIVSYKTAYFGKIHIGVARLRVAAVAMAERVDGNCTLFSLHVASWQPSHHFLELA